MMFKLLKYVAILIVGLELISIDLNWFLVSALILVLIVIDTKINYIRKQMKIYQISNEVRLITIAKKLKITEQDGNFVKEEMFGNMTEEEIKILLKEKADIGL